MDFSIPGSETWESTDVQTVFIKNYFNLKRKKKEKLILRDRKKIHADKNELLLKKQETNSINKYTSILSNEPDLKANKAKIKRSKLKRKNKMLDNKIVCSEKVKCNAQVKSVFENNFGVGIISKGAKRKAQKIKVSKSKFKRQIPVANFYDETLHENTNSDAISEEFRLSNINLEVNLLSNENNLNLPMESESENFKSDSKLIQVKPISKNKKFSLIETFEDISDDEDDNKIREEIKDLEIYKKLQKISKKACFEIESNDLIDSSEHPEPDNKPELSNRDRRLISNDSPEEEEKIEEMKSQYKLSKKFTEESDNKNRMEKPKNNESSQSKAKQKLQAAKFRCLNEKLYTETGKESLRYFQDNVEDFNDYHLGYSQQVCKWPMNPVDKIINQLKKMKPKTVIADLGCGDAKIARILSHQHQIHSYDLVSLNKYVKACDISKVPLQNESVDVVVFCLSLMGKNLKDYICEANRILKLGGVLKIAEVESRVDVKKFITDLKPFGFHLQNQDLEHKIFIFLDFKKDKKHVKRSKIPEITLKPCRYKKR